VICLGRRSGEHLGDPVREMHSARIAAGINHDAERIDGYIDAGWFHQRCDVVTQQRPHLPVHGLEEGLDMQVGVTFCVQQHAGAFFLSRVQSPSPPEYARAGPKVRPLGGRKPWPESSLSRPGARSCAVPSWTVMDGPAHISPTNDQGPTAAIGDQALHLLLRSVAPTGFEPALPP
jgi:hypothetical protein